jgi:hypothetical protein
MDDLVKELRRWDKTPASLPDNVLERAAAKIEDHRASVAILAELVALVPISETIEVSRTGNTLIAWFKAALAQSNRREIALREALPILEWAAESTQENVDLMYAARVVLPAIRTALSAGTDNGPER